MSAFPPPSCFLLMVWAIRSPFLCQSARRPFSWPSAPRRPRFLRASRRIGRRSSVGSRRCTPACWPARTWPKWLRPGCGDVSPRESRCRRRSGAAGSGASASISWMASARRRCCTSSFPIGPMRCTTAARAVPSPATPSASSMMTAIRLHAANKANCKLPGQAAPKATGTIASGPALRFWVRGRARAISMSSVRMAVWFMPDEAMTC